MDYAWLALPLLMAVLDWIAVSRNWLVVHAIAKQLVMIGLIAWLWFFTNWSGVLLWFGLALVFSWAGDVFLLSKDYFLPGLIAFLLAHIAYLLGLNLNNPLLSAVSVGIVIGTALVVILIYPPIRIGLLRRSSTRKLEIPVLVYGVVLSLMMLSTVATLFRLEWAVWTAILMAAGGILFFISDNILARDRFVHTIRNGQVLNLVTYHLGQIAIIAAAVIHFGKL